MRSCEAGQPASHEPSIIAILQLKEWTCAEHPHANSDRPANGVHAWERNERRFITDYEKAVMAQRLPSDFCNESDQEQAKCDLMGSRVPMIATCAQV